MQTGIDMLVDSLEALYKAKYKLAVWSSTCTPKYLAKQAENTSAQKICT